MVSATALLVEEPASPFQTCAVELEPLQPSEVLVEVKATGICHTDAAVQHGKLPAGYPIVLGHEGAGIVLEVGSAVHDLAVGDHVLLSYSYCGECHNCKRERPYQCSRIFERNFQARRPDGSLPIKWNGRPIHGCFFGQSSFSNPAIVQAASCVPVSADLPLEVLAPLGCGVQTGAGSIFNVVNPVQNETRSVVVFGIGGVGSAAIMAAHAVHMDHPNLLTTIIAVDVQRDRLELAAELGATHIIQSSSDPADGVAEIHRITKGEGVDAAIDCTGAIPVINAMIGALSAGGIAVTVGVPSGTAEASIQVFGFVNGCKTYRGSHQGNSFSRKFLPFLADLYLRGRLPIDRLQKRYKPSEINTAVQDLLEGKVMKPVIVWSEE